MGDPPFARDPRFVRAAGRLAQRAELDRQIADWTRNFDAHELMRELQGQGVEAGVVQNYGDLLGDPQLAHRGHFQTLAHARLGELRVEHCGIRFSAHPPRLRTAGPKLGQHNQEVLDDFLGCGREEFEGLVEREILT
jgi:formyl-CoA transferase